MIGRVVSHYQVDLRRRVADEGRHLMLVQGFR
jgi:hypothetical protein